MKIAMFTDIHWGAKSNSVGHNQDCLDFIDWFIENSKDCDAYAFLGDWFEHRNAVNISTLNYSFDGIKKLNEQGKKIYFITGNHDLYHRESRAQFSTYHFEKLENVVLVNEVYFENDMMFVPYIFKKEYPEIAKLISKNKPKYVFGHFEFNNFVITGADRRMEHGFDHSVLSGPKYIFSGHFHKRQARDNTIYIGNTFPTNYGDAWDDARGMCILDTSNDDVDFIDWLDCPRYRKVKLSDVFADDGMTFPPKCRVRCMIDIDIGYSEAQALREEFTKIHGLREFVLEENILEKKDAIIGEEVMEEFDLSSLDDAVVRMIETGITGTSTIDSKKLVEIYQQL